MVEGDFSAPQREQAAARDFGGAQERLEHHLRRSAEEHAVARRQLVEATEALADMRTRFADATAAAAREAATSAGSLRDMETALAVRTRDLDDGKCACAAPWRPRES